MTKVGKGRAEARPLHKGAEYRAPTQAKAKGRSGKGATELLPVSADKRIDFVDDPVIFEKNGKERSYHPK